MIQHSSRSWKLLAATALFGFVTSCGGGSSSGTNDDTGTVPPPDNGLNFNNIAVHDPSVIKVDNTYYVFGSHLSAAKSDDLMNWERVADGVTASNPLFDNVVEELAETLEWAETDTLWATDVIQLEDGKYYMYYNACRGDAPLSAMGVAVADNIEGPYVNKEMFLRSGMVDEPSEDGTAYDARVHPNVVDPDVFFDHQGRLWMVYGSYSGGIFILEMDWNTGLPLPDQGYGKHLMGGNHSRIEGPYVLYSPETGYYYMFTSFGGLDATGGYNMRVSRSLTPDGPYLDAMDNDMADVKSDFAFDDASIEPFAQKLMGNFRFDGTDATAYVSPGHNSAYYDADSGKYFLIFHTRFPGRGEQHEVRVHEMYMNADGWPVVVPHRYAPLSIAEDDTLTEAIAEDEIPGNYQLINHGKDISATIKTAQSISLGSDGFVSGDANGSWAFGENNQISIELTDQGIFEGVTARSWDPAQQEFVVTFSALSREGVAIWGSREND
jgi:arabinan endo-1,5-alpha-L-arabinosidase